MEDFEGAKSVENIDAVAGARTSPSHLERLPSAGVQDWKDEVEEEESSDDDRNHKHRRRVSRSRSTDRVDEPNNISRYHGGGGASNDLKRENHGRGHDRERFSRRGGRDGGGARDGILRGNGPPFRGDGRRDMGRGRGWVGPMPPPFGDTVPLLPPNAGYFPNGRGMGGRGGGGGWPGGFGHMGGMGAGSLERGPPPGVMNLGMGMGIGPVRPRCLDFEERGFCLRGDLCPMDHGSHIVVEDVQSLSKFNLPVNLPNGRGMVVAPGPMAASNSMLPAVAPSSSRGNRGSREPSIPPLDVPIALNGQVSGAEPDLYDPDQPLWNKDRPEATGRIRKLSSAFQTEQTDLMDKEKVDLLKKNLVDGGSRGANNGGLDAGSTVWDRIGPVDHVNAGISLEMKLEEQQRGQGRGVNSWQQGRWGEPDVNVATLMSANPGRGRGAAAGWAEVGPPFNRPKEPGTNSGLRASGRSVERAQCTLYVSCIPPNSNRAEVLLMHFEKFGRVVDVRIPPHSDRAFVQFGTREEAESALASPDAVMGNRFIRLSWANRDSITSDNGASTSFTGQSPTTHQGIHEPPTDRGHAAQSVKGRGKLGFTGLNGVVASMSGASITEPGSNKATTSSNDHSASSLPTPAAMVSKKQEELELMREKIRQKQEALAQKRDDFRRKLDKLASQGAIGTEEHVGEQATKRQKTSAGDVRVSKETVGSNSPASTGLRKTSSGEAAQVGVQQPVSLKPVRSPRPRTASGVSSGHPSVAWGPARFKLDNRTTTFRVLPPLPATVTDVAAVREHFAVFGELSSVEVEDAGSSSQKTVESGQPLTANNPIRVSYTTRRSAERAMTQGRWFHGQTLNLAWVSTKPSESLAPANKAAVAAEPEINSREGDAPEESSPHHVEESQVATNITTDEEALQTPAQVM